MPRRVVTDADVEKKFIEVDKPYVLAPVDAAAALGLCVLADVSLAAPGFSWRRERYLVELLDDQAEPFGRIAAEIAASAPREGEACAFSFDVDLDVRAALAPEFEAGLAKGLTVDAAINLSLIHISEPTRPY